MLQAPVDYTRLCMGHRFRLKNGPNQAILEVIVLNVPGQYTTEIHMSFLKELKRRTTFLVTNLACFLCTIIVVTNEPTGASLTPV